MSNIFYGHAPLKSGLFLLNLDSSDTHIHSVEAKICRCNTDDDMASCDTQANDMATTANNWKIPGASVSGVT